MARDALVVGINAYQYLPSLQAPARDAEAIAQQLHTYGEFRVHRIPEVLQAGKPQIGLKTPVTLHELETALVNLFKPKGNNPPHTALFYYSGHGIQREAGIREGFLAVSDANPDKGFCGLSLFWLRRLLQESPVRQRIVILDCCHSGELLNFLEADPGAQAGTDRLFMAASREYETAYESLDGPYSVFTQALLSGLDPNRIEAGLVTNHSLTDWVNHSLKGEIQQPLFESSGSEIILTRVNGAQPRLTPQTVKSTDICPYRGLEFFDETHAEFFFGREELTLQLIDQLKNQRFAAVTGASGSGKSSLLRAGVISHLQQEKLPSGADAWKIKLITPAEHPLKSLAAAFIDPELNDLDRAEQLRRAEAFLQDGSIGLAQLVRASLAMEGGTTGLLSKARPQMLLVIDQFEEVFTLTRGTHIEEERQQFFNCLLGALQAMGDSLSIAIVVRADFLNNCALYDGLAQKIEQHRVMVTPLKYEQIKATIVRPAQKVGLVCEPNLVYTMLLDIIGAPGELPLLQFTLLELWEHRRTSTEGGVARMTLDTYRELGGVRGTLQKQATEVYSSLSAEEQAVAKRIFLALTQLGEGTEDTRRRVLKSELIAPAFPAEMVESVLEQLVAAKLIVTNQEPIRDSDNSQLFPSAENCSTQEVVDVAHEALIRNWPLLKDWIDENRDMLRRQRRIEGAAQEWDSTGGQSAKGEYLLQGLKLRDAEDFLRLYPQELSALAQQYIAVSQSAIRRARRESRQIQFAVPSVLLATLAMVLSQYHGTIKTRLEQEHQLQVATSRQRALMAQTVLQDSKSDPMVALLISRLAAEEGRVSYETQSSLRAALQNLRLQLELRGHEGAIHQIAFSPDRQNLATASADGTIRLWSLNSQTIYNTVLQPSKVLTWSDSNDPANAGASGVPADILSLAFSPNGRQIAAIAKDSPEVKVWSVEAGAVLLELPGLAATKQVMFSPNGQWILATHRDQTISIWSADTGKLQTRIPMTGAIQDLQLSPDGRFLLAIAEGGTVQLLQLKAHPTDGLKAFPVAGLGRLTGIHQATFSPSGRWVAIATEDNKVRVWDSTTGKSRGTFSQDSQAAPGLLQIANPWAVENRNAAAQSQPIVQMKFSPNEQVLATTDPLQRVWLWDLNSGKLQQELTPQDSGRSRGNTASTSPVEPLSFSPDGRMLVTVDTTSADQDQTAHLWDIETGKEVAALPGHQGFVSTVQFSPDSSYVATASADGIVRFWSTESGSELPTLKLTDAPVHWAMFLQSGNAGRIGSIPNNPSPSAKSASETSSSASSTAAQRAGAGSINQMISITSDGRLQRWQILTDAVTVMAKAGKQPSASALNHQVSPQNFSGFFQWLLSFLRKRTQRLNANQSPVSGMNAETIHNSPMGAPMGIEAAQAATVLPNLAAIATKGTAPNPIALSGAVLSPDGQRIVTAKGDGILEIYQVLPDQSMQLLHRIQNWRATDDQSGVLSSVLPSTSGTVAMAANTVNAPVAKSASPVPNPVPNPVSSPGANASGDPVVIRQLAFSADGRLVVGAAADFTVRLWDVQSGELVQTLRGHQATVEQARFSSDGQSIVTASLDRTARVWNVTSGQLLNTLKQEREVSSASFSPDGQSIVTAGWDGVARIWDVNSGQEKVPALASHQDALFDAQFSPDGTMVVTASADGTAKLWNAETGQEQAQLSPGVTGEPTNPVLQAFFSPDGQYVATLTEDGRIYLWAATWDMLLKLARDRSFRQLTPEECTRYLQLTPETCPKLPMSRR